MNSFSVVTKGAIDHIESEIRNYDVTLNEIDFLEEFYLCGVSFDSWPKEMLHLRRTRLGFIDYMII